MGDIPVRYLGGAGGKPRVPGVLVVESSGVAFRLRQKTPLSWAWGDVRRLSFDDPGRTKVNLPALLGFGMLAVGARKAFSLLVVSTGDGDVFFETEYPIGTWRSVAPRIPNDVPEAAGKVFVEGAAVDAAVDGGDVLAQLEKLGQLRDAGVLTEQEFAAKKAELLNRL